AAMFRAERNVEAAVRAGVVVGIGDVEGGTRGDVRVPLILLGELVGELEVECEQREVVADADFDVRPEAQVVDELFRLDMTAKIELIQLSGYGDAYNGRQLRARICCDEHEKERQSCGSWCHVTALCTERTVSMRISDKAER